MQCWCWAHMLFFVSSFTGPTYSRLDRKDTLGYFFLCCSCCIGWHELFDYYRILLATRFGGFVYYVYHNSGLIVQVQYDLASHIAKLLSLRHNFNIMECWTSNKPEWWKPVCFVMSHNNASCMYVVHKALWAVLPDHRNFCSILHQKAMLDAHN